MIRWILHEEHMIVIAIPAARMGTSCTLGGTITENFKRSSAAGHYYSAGIPAMV